MRRLSQIVVLVLLAGVRVSAQSPHSDALTDDHAKCHSPAGLTDASFDHDLTVAPKYPSLLYSTDRALYFDAMAWGIRPLTMDARYVSELLVMSGQDALHDIRRQMRSAFETVSIATTTAQVNIDHSRSTGVLEQAFHAMEVLRTEPKTADK